MIRFTVYVLMTHFAPTQLRTHRWLGRVWCSVINVDNETCNDATWSFLELLRAIERNPINPEVHLSNSSTTSNLTSSGDYDSCDVNANESRIVSPSMLSLKPAHCTSLRVLEKSRTELESMSKLTRDGRPPIADFSFDNYTKCCCALCWN